MKFREQLLQNSPLSSKLEIDTFFAFVKERKTQIDNVHKELLLSHTVPNLHDYLIHVIELYRMSYKAVPKIKKTNYKNRRKADNIKRGGLSSSDQKTLSMYSFRENNKGNTLSAMGYEYGLSDW